VGRSILNRTVWLGLYDLDVDTNTLFDDIYWICCGQRKHRLAREDATLAAVLRGQKKKGLAGRGEHG